ncbi:MAG: helix-turn-helix domain-containing protein [Planctomycetia bacterium]|nr:helix-turn-helix domain-containing protein [Planctomycetia bacterium]
MAHEADRLLTEVEAAELLSIRRQTLSVWRCTKRYPLDYVKIGRSVRYKMSAINKFLERRTVTYAEAA